METYTETCNSCQKGGQAEPPREKGPNMASKTKTNTITTATSKRAAKPAPKRFTKVGELREFAALMEQKREIERKLEACKARAAVTLGAADAVTIGSYTLKRQRRTVSVFSKAVCVARYGASLYEACKVEQERTGYIVGRDL